LVGLLCRQITDDSRRYKMKITVKIIALTLSFLTISCVDRTKGDKPDIQYNGLEVDVIFNSNKERALVSISETIRQRAPGEGSKIAIIFSPPILHQKEISKGESGSFLHKGVEVKYLYAYSPKDREPRVIVSYIVE
jgi:hypothetical protein